MNLYAVKSHDHYKLVDKEYDMIVKKLVARPRGASGTRRSSRRRRDADASPRQPRRRRGPPGPALGARVAATPPRRETSENPTTTQATHGDVQPQNVGAFGERHAFEWEYRPVLALTLNNTTIAPKVFQNKRRLALFLERVVVKALASTTLDGVDTIVGAGVAAAQKFLTTTLGTVDRCSKRVGGPGGDVVGGAAEAGQDAGLGALKAGRKVAHGVASGAKSITAGVMNGLTKGNATVAARGLADGVDEIASGVAEGASDAIQGASDASGKMFSGVGRALRYVPVVGHVAGGAVDATGHLVSGSLGVAGGVLGGVVGGLGAAGLTGRAVSLVFWFCLREGRAVRGFDAAKKKDDPSGSRGFDALREGRR